jgi:hypothetical protein
MTIFLTVGSETSRLYNGQKLSPIFFLVLNIFTIKKAAVVSNFCLIGKISHNFLVPRMIELVCKTFMPIQSLDLHRVSRPGNKVYCYVVLYSNIYLITLRCQLNM